MIIQLSGDGGVGKLTIGRLIATAVSGRLIDNHTIYNPAFAVTEFRSVRFYEVVRSVREIVFREAARIDAAVPLVLTVATGRDEAWGRDWQGAIRALADARASMLFGVHLVCDPAEHRRRIGDPTRALLRKATDPALLEDGLERPVLLDHCDAIVRLDTTHLTPALAAEAIIDRAASLVQPTDQPPPRSPPAA